MNARAHLQADAAAIRAFVEALFAYAEPDTFASLRAFRDDIDGAPPFLIEAAGIGDGLDGLIAAAVAAAERAANAREPVVFCPPVATFTNAVQAREADLANGIALSVECDATPAAARARLEALLGPATVVVASGGEWLNPATGEVEPKLHLHWRLTEPTADAEGHAMLKLARTIAAGLVGADASNTPITHPIRWPGTWHRKGAPRLARIEALAPQREIDLGDALAALREAADAAGWSERRKGAGEAQGASTGTGEARETAELVRALMTAEDYHAAATALAMRMLKAGMPDAQAVLFLRGFMLAIPVEQRDVKNGTAEPGRWQARFDAIPRAVSTARAKLGDPKENPAAADAWPDPVDFLGDADLTGAPALKPDHLPDAIAGFAFDTAARMGVDPAAVALACIVTCAAVVTDDWRIQPKVHDDTWTECARLWGLIVGDPSILKSPVLRAATGPVDALEAEARERHAEAMRAWKAEVAALKADKGNAPIPAQPKCDRYMVEGTTTEALSEVLRDDEDARFRAPARKVLMRQDELSGWLADMDRYRAGGKGGGDRAQYLTLFNGGRYVYDRVGRGSFAIPNWSACVVGGIQPEPIQRIAKEAADDGLLQRFLYCVPAAQGEGEDRRPDRGALDRYKALVQALTMLRPSLGVPGANLRPMGVVFHADAHRHREAINGLVKAHAAMPDASARLKAALGKWPGIFARLALTFHLIGIADARAQGAAEPVANVLAEDTARRAAAYMRDVLLPHLLRAEGLLFLTRQTGHARWIAGHILASPAIREASRVALRDVQRAYGPLKAPEHRRELTEVLTALEVMGWLRAELPDNPARPVAAWRVNPKLFATFAKRAAEERQRREAAQAATAEAIRRAQPRDAA
jgi:hypothetical protein